MSVTLLVDTPPKMVWDCEGRTTLTPMDFTRPCFCASTHALHTSFLTLGPPMAECIRYRSKYSTWDRLSDFFRSEKVWSYDLLLRSLDVR